MANMHSKFQVTSHVNGTNLRTFADGTLTTRNPRCGQWVKTAWSDRRGRFVGVTRQGVICLDLYSGGDFKAFGDKVAAWKAEHGPQLSFNF
jgi:hypothetical protein